MVRIAIIALAFAATAFTATTKPQGSFGAGMYLSKRQNNTADATPEIGSPEKIDQMIKAFEKKLEESPDKELKKLYDDTTKEIQKTVQEGIDGNKSPEVNKDPGNKPDDNGNGSDKATGPEKGSNPDKSPAEQPRASGV
ncbi:hypothetical protein HIM_01548 [Hirsutella minnesotensis 3608]|nr:hypothetical protein HIM_01548 [Hirsutella minnesotensis 3608]